MSWERKKMSIQEAIRRYPDKQTEILKAVNMTKITGFSSEHGGIVTYEGFDPPTQQEINDYLKEKGMCWCNPEIRTPNCGKIQCYPPRGYMENQLKAMGLSPDATKDNYIEALNREIADERRRADKLGQENVRLQRDLERSELLLRELQDLYRSLKFVKLEPLGEREFDATRPGG